MRGRVGFGFDVHRFAAQRKLMLGGVEIPFDRGLAGHSDADVVLHAVTDALLGAAALGDIGMHFPDTDPEWEGADSGELLAACAALVDREGYVIENVDVTIVAQIPKLRPYVDKMRNATAGCLKLDPSAVSIKATTTERLGFEGRAEGISAYAVCLICDKETS